MAGSRVRVKMGEELRVPCIEPARRPACRRMFDRDLSNLYSGTAKIGVAFPGFPFQDAVDCPGAWRGRAEGRACAKWANVPAGVGEGEQPGPATPAGSPLRNQHPSFFPSFYDHTPLHHDSCMLHTPPFPLASSSPGQTVAAQRSGRPRPPRLAATA